jgi:peptidyl-prolyl cis-trans isomerase SurA
MKLKILITTFLILFFSHGKNFANENILIKIKINNQIVTNFDLEKEFKYLTALNPNLKNISNELKIKIAKDSMVKEIIKKDELKKYFDLNQSDQIILQFIKNFYLNLGISDEVTFEKYLNEHDWSLEDVKQKIKIEVLWNQLIFERFRNQIKIDEDELKKRIDRLEKEEIRIFYDLSEIVFQVEKNKTYKDTINSINKSIQEIGFENTANLYSISDSAKIGGKIGWVEENSLSSNISQEIKKIAISDNTNPVNIKSKFIILKLNNIKKEKKIINKKNELLKLIKSEENRQLNNFSKIFFDKIKINTKIYEY